MRKEDEERIIRTAIEGMDSRIFYCEDACVRTIANCKERSDAAKNKSVQEPNGLWM